MRRILVVDDEPLIAMMVEDWLEELGYTTVGPANSVTSALGLINDNAPDGAILDVSLSGENSYSVAEELLSRRIPFAFATGRGANDVDVRFRNALMLAKPFDFDAVKGVIDRMFDRPAP
jgi:DNA-binding response OmpR family regulator